MAPSAFDIEDVATSDLPPVHFTTFGMFILDEIHWLMPKSMLPSKYNLVGGAGTYAALGARLALSDSQPGSNDVKAVSWIVDAGLDFPVEARDKINSWNTNCVLREDTARLTTRAWNGYGEREHRDFKYLTPKKRLEVSSLNVRQTKSKSFHMVCSPERCRELVASLTATRKNFGVEEKPIIVWEPIPDLCSPAELTNLQEAAKGCTIISPNCEELRMFFPDQRNVAQEELVHRLLGYDRHDAGADSGLQVVVREGADGCTVYVPRFSSDSGSITTSAIHFPAYHTIHSRPDAVDSATRVIDPTGGGNTFLGALAIALTDMIFDRPLAMLIQQKLRLQRQQLGMQSTNASADTVIIAIIYALIAASYAIEQHGVPSVSRSEDGSVELWNATSFLMRVEHYLDREAHLIMDQIEARTSEAAD